MQRVPGLATFRSDAEFLRDLLILETFGGPRNNAGTFYDLRWHEARSRMLLQGIPLSRGQIDRPCDTHRIVLYCKDMAHPIAVYYS